MVIQKDDVLMHRQLFGKMEKWNIRVKNNVAASSTERSYERIPALTPISSSIWLQSRVACNRAPSPFVREPINILQLYFASAASGSSCRTDRKTILVAVTSHSLLHTWPGTVQTDHHRWNRKNTFSKEAFLILSSV